MGYLKRRYEPLGTKVGGDRKGGGLLTKHTSILGHRAKHLAHGVMESSFILPTYLAVNLMVGQ